MFSNKIIVFNKVLILGLIISNCNSTTLKYNGLNNIYLHDTLKKFYQQESEATQNDSSTTQLTQEDTCDLITQVQISQNQVIEIVNEVVNKINNNGH